MDVSSVTRGLVNLTQAIVDSNIIARDAIEQSRPLLESRRHTLTVQLAGSTVPVAADRNRLVQIVANLLNNAAKYTPDGGHISLSVRSADGHALVEVQDNGIGIDAAFLPHVFDLFVQAKRTLDRSQGGLGIGLALVKSLVELHGGHIKARSAGPGMGSTFTVAIPVATT